MRTSGKENRWMREARNERGFLILEVLIAGLILTASIAATMYLFKMGFEHLERANDSNVLSAKLPLAVALLRSLDLERKEGTEDMGDGVTLRWEAKLVEKGRPVYDSPEGSVQSPYEVFLYRVSLRLDFKRLGREYEMDFFRSVKTDVSVTEVF
ncbi:MAG: hypothetical protein K8I29_12470 [Alphaproteobacteria bacterium]|uniref:Uncharacterized protein n=1 Tax=Candidatus Nitrobium versatile TaxID=2884831 RepID=A0A953JDB6_9BACT|nr:hypothetical protein [Candidatus Nitrobium versatile]